MLFLKIVVWVVAVVAGVVLSFSKKAKEELRHSDDFPFTWKPIRSVVGVVLVIILTCVLLGVGSVPSGHKGVVTRWGAVTGRVIPEGAYVVVPFADSVNDMSVQLLKWSSDASAASKDLQEVHTKVTLTFYPDPQHIASIYQTMRQDYVPRIIEPAIQEAVKASTAQFDAEKLITERATVKDKMFQYLKQRLLEQHFIAESLQITDFDFSPSFKAAIEAKVTASQEALKADRDLARIKTEAQQKIESAKAEAESLRIQKEQVTPQLVELRRIEVSRLAVQKWNGVMPQTVTGNGPVPILDIFNKK